MLTPCSLPLAPCPSSLTSHSSPLTSEEEFDLSDLSVKPKEKTREDIIAEAEAAAFAEG